ncbi:hypothetical protein [uncultured Croceitalea sp.]|uniref:hypothetical protein n=1 Tax=uncultured Croceitalea sp. TaxID=1798908 RepID=UPI00374F4280
MKKNHKNKFKTPEGYFDNFNERLIDKIIKEDSLIPKGDGFAVPKDYFESFNTKISNKVNQEQPRVIHLKPYKKYYYAAASIAAILLFSFWFSQYNQTQLGFDDLASAELDAYFEKTDLDFSSYELAEVINLDEVSILDITEIDNIQESKMILEYLDDNIDEIEDLNLDYDEFE